MFGVHYKILANWLKGDARGWEQRPEPKGRLKRILDTGDLERIDQIVAPDPSITVHELMQKNWQDLQQGVYSLALKELGYTFTILLPQIRRGDVVIMDNARIHMNSFDIALFESK